MAEEMETLCSNGKQTCLWWAGRVLPVLVFLCLALVFLSTSFLSPWVNSQSFLAEVMRDIKGQGPNPYVLMYHYCFTSLGGLCLSFLAMGFSLYSGRKVLCGILRGITLASYWCFWIGCVVLDWIVASQFYRPQGIAHSMLHMPWYRTLPYVFNNSLWILGGTIAAAMLIRPWRFRKKFGWTAIVSSLIGLTLLNHLFCSSLFVCIGPHGVE